VLQRFTFVRADPRVRPSLTACCLDLQSTIEALRSADCNAAQGEEILGAQTAAAARHRCYKVLQSLLDVSALGEVRQPSTVSRVTLDATLEDFQVAHTPRAWSQSGTPRDDDTFPNSRSSSVSTRSFASHMSTPRANDGSLASSKLVQISTSPTALPRAPWGVGGASHTSRAARAARAAKETRKRLKTVPRARPQFPTPRVRISPNLDSKVSDEGRRVFASAGSGLGQHSPLKSPNSPQRLKSKSKKKKRGKRNARIRIHTASRGRRGKQKIVTVKFPQVRAQIGALRPVSKPNLAIFDRHSFLQNPDSDSDDELSPRGGRLRSQRLKTNASKNGRRARTSAADRRQQGGKPGEDEDDTSAPRHQDGHSQYTRGTDTMQNTSRDSDIGSDRDGDDVEYSNGDDDDDSTLTASGPPTPRFVRNASPLFDAEDASTSPSQLHRAPSIMQRRQSFTNANFLKRFRASPLQRTTSWVSDGMSQGSSSDKEDDTVATLPKLEVRTAVGAPVEQPERGPRVSNFTQMLETYSRLLLSGVWSQPGLGLMKILRRSDSSFTVAGPDKSWFPATLDLIPDSKDGLPLQLRFKTGQLVHGEAEMFADDGDDVGGWRHGVRHHMPQAHLAWRNGIKWSLLEIEGTYLVNKHQVVELAFDGAQQSLSAVCVQPADHLLPQMTGALVVDRDGETHVHLREHDGDHWKLGVWFSPPPSREWSSLSGPRGRIIFDHQDEWVRYVGKHAVGLSNGTIKSSVVIQEAPADPIPARLLPQLGAGHGSRGPRTSSPAQNQRRQVQNDFRQQKYRLQEQSASGTGAADFTRELPVRPRTMATKQRLRSVQKHHRNLSQPFARHVTSALAHVRTDEDLDALTDELFAVHKPRTAIPPISGKTGSALESSQPWRPRPGRTKSLAPKSVLRTRGSFVDNGSQWT